MAFQIIRTASAATAITEECIGDNCAPSLRSLETVFGNVVGVALGFAGIVLFIMLLSGGFRYITAGGDPKSIEGAKKTLTYAIAGLVLITLAFLILRFIESFTGAEVTQFKIFQP